MVSFVSFDERHQQREEKNYRDKEKYLSKESEWKRTGGGTTKLEKH